MHCVVTSPPYWGLRDYGADGQIGLEETADEYVQCLVSVFRAVKRVLRKDGTLWLNLGDSYWRNPKRGNQEVGGHAGLRTGRTAAAAMQHKTSTLPEKSLVGIPWRVALALQDDGWILRTDIIWHKPNPMPESITDRPTRSHEFIFLLTKSRHYYYDGEAIKEPAVSGHPSGNRYKREERKSLNGRGQIEQWPPSGTRNRRDVWTVAVKPFKEAHFATFPADLIMPCVLAGCPREVCVRCGTPDERIVEKHRSFESGSGRSGNDPAGKHGEGVQGGGETRDVRRGPLVSTRTTGWKRCNCGKAFAPGVVLDPFMGSGTTALVALQHGRQFIGCELNPEYIKIAMKRLHPYLNQKRIQAHGMDEPPEPSKSQRSD